MTCSKGCQHAPFFILVIATSVFQGPRCWTASVGESDLVSSRRPGTNNSHNGHPAVCMTVLLVALFPANVRAAREILTVGGRQATPLPLRAPSGTLRTPE